MRNLLIIAFIANILLTLVSPIILPSEVAIHFGKGGVPNSWASKEVNALIFLAIELPLFILFISAHFLPLKLHPKFVSLPNKNYWLKKENQQKMKGKLASIMAEFGFVLFIFLFCTGLLTIEANLSDPIKLNERIFVPIFIAFMLYTAYWVVKIVRAFKVPKTGDPDDKVLEEAGSG